MRNIHKRSLIFFTQLLLLQGLLAQESNHIAFGDGEELKYIGSYNMSAIWTDLAEVTLKVTEVTSTKTPVLRLQGTASTYSSWDSYFKVRDSYQSWVNPTTIKPLIYKRDMYEGGYTKDLKYIFKHKNNQAKSIEKYKDGEVKEKTIQISDDTYDLVSAIYYMRNLNYPDFETDKVTQVKVLIDNKTETIYATYKGKVNLKTKNMGTILCYKVAISLNDEKILKGKESNNIYLTADKNRVPIFIKAQIPVGSIQVRLTEMNGLKYKEN